MPEAPQPISTTERVLCGLAINIVNFKHLWKRQDPGAAVDHIALIYILDLKTEPPKARIKRLLEVLNVYSLTPFTIWKEKT